MLRQLRKLLLPVGDPAQEMIAPAIYATPDGMPPGNESGYEGVTCVDDAARAAILYARIWRERGDLWARDILLGLMRFVLAMQQPSGRFLNFILDWTGRRNYEGPTSEESLREWSSRAFVAMIAAWQALCSEEQDAAWCAVLEGAIERTWPHLMMPGVVGPDIRAMHLHAGLQLRGTKLAQRLQPNGLDGVLLAWGNEIATFRQDGILLNHAGEFEGQPVHLWGHIQEGVLAEAAVALDCPDWLVLAEESGQHLLVPVVRDGFPQSGLCPFDISSVIKSLDGLARATGKAEWADLAAQARDWFTGRNPAGQPVYDRSQGRVFDGIDHGQLNPNSGAEANIEAALVLFDQIDWVAVEQDMRANWRGSRVLGL